MFTRHWLRLPTQVRRPVVLFVGLTFVITAGLIGWLPGPGGIPLFLVGVAILATEFAWAERFKRFLLEIVHRTGAWLKVRPGVIWLVVVAIVICTALGMFEFWRRFSQ